MLQGADEGGPGMGEVVMVESFEGSSAGWPDQRVFRSHGRGRYVAAGFGIYGCGFGRLYSRVWRQQEGTIAQFYRDALGGGALFAE